MIMVAHSVIRDRLGASIASLWLRLNRAPSLSLLILRNLSYCFPCMCAANRSRVADGPCIVKINIFVRSISRISDLDAVSSLPACMPACMPLPAQAFP